MWKIWLMNYLVWGHMLISGWRGLWVPKYSSTKKIVAPRRSKRNYFCTLLRKHSVLANFTPSTKVLIGYMINKGGFRNMTETFNWSTHIYQWHTLKAKNDHEKESPPVRPQKAYWLWCISTYSPVQGPPPVLSVGAGVPPVPFPD